MITFEIDATDEFQDIAPEEERRFFQVGRNAVRSAVKRLHKAVRAHTPVHHGPYPARRSRTSGTLRKAFIYRVRTRKRDGMIEGKVQPKGAVRAKGGQWHIARFLEFGTKRGIAPRRFIEIATLEQQSAIDHDLESVAD